MSELAHKAAKCVADGCGKEILIGKFASLKTAYCEEHVSLRPKPTPPAPKKKEGPAPAAIPGDSKPIAESPIPGQAAQAAAPIAGLGAPPAAIPVVAPAGQAQAAALISPAPAASTVPPPPPAPVVPTEPQASPSTPKDLKDAFSALLGKQLKKEPAKLLMYGFAVTQHGIVNKRFEDNRILSLIELKGLCIGVGLSFNGATEGYFDVSTIHNLKPDERSAVIAAKDACL